MTHELTCMTEGHSHKARSSFGKKSVLSKPVSGLGFRVSGFQVQVSGLEFCPNMDKFRGFR